MHFLKTYLEFSQKYKILVKDSLNEDIKRIIWQIYKQLILNHPIDERKLGRICSYTKPLCVSHDEFLESNFNIGKARNYLFIKKNKN